jgi:hypothetical protein
VREGSGQAFVQVGIPSLQISDIFVNSAEVRNVLVGRVDWGGLGETEGLSVKGLAATDESKPKKQTLLEGCSLHA